MYLIKSIDISNYKSCKLTKCEFSAYTPIVGCNNVGKSTILSALEWIFSGSSLDERFFNDRQCPIVVSVEIVGITKDILEVLDSKHKVAIEPYCLDERIKIQRQQPEPNASKKEIKLSVWDWKKETWVSNPTGIDNAISGMFPDIIYIQAMQDAAEDVAKFKTGSTIGKLVSLISEKVTASHESELKPHLDAIESILGASGDNRSEHLIAIDNGASSKLQDFFPGLSIKVHMPTPEIKEIFKTATIKIREVGQPEDRDISSVGHGAQRSIQMALIRHLAEEKRGEQSKVTRLLLIDEPEIYLHPQAIEQLRKSLERLVDSGYQVIFNTHSPHMIGKENVKRTLIVRRNPDGTHTLPRVESVVAQVIQEAEHQADILFSLSNASQILFTDNVLLVEGKTEITLLPQVIELLQGKSPAELKTAIVAMNGTGDLKGMKSVLNSVGISTRAIADLDYALQHAVKAGYLSETHSSLIALRSFMLGLRASGLIIGDNGVPEKKSRDDAYKALIADTAIQAHCKSIAIELRKHGIWLWTNGTIENHLGLNGKTRAIWDSYLEKIKEGFDAATHDAPTVRELMEWLFAKEQTPKTSVNKAMLTAIEDAMAHAEAKPLTSNDGHVSLPTAHLTYTPA